MASVRTYSLAVTLLVTVTGLGYDTIGQLIPFDEPAILVSVPNIGEYADYTFRYWTTNAIPAGGYMVVTFPQQYQSGLGIAGNPVCIGGPCTLSFLTVTVTLDAGCGVSQNCQFSILALKNPSTMGGTGPFVLTSYTGVNIIDTNAVFGVVGIAGPITALTTGSFNFAAGESNYAGETAAYDIYLRSATPLYLGTWIRVTIPADGFGFNPVPLSQLIALDGSYLPGIISCTYSNFQLTIQGMSAQVSAGTDIGIRVTGSNPQRQGTTGTFTIETGKGGTSVVYSRKSSISGLSITAGRLSGVSLAPVSSTILLTTKEIVQYTLKFTLFNEVAAGGKIVITCSSAFNLDGLTNLWLNSGLADESLTQPLTLTYSIPTKVLTITGFGTYKSGEISLNLEMKNPVNSGKTTPLVIQSFRADGTTLIDQDQVSAYVTILSTGSPILSPTYLSPNTASGLNFNLQINIQPGVTIPAQGFIQVRVPTGFNTSPGTVNCLATPLFVATDLATCSFAGNVVTLQLFINTALVPAGAGTFNANAPASFQIITGLLAPTSAGAYVFEVSTYDTTGTNLLESGTCTVLITAKAFTTASVSSLHSRISSPSLLSFAFTPLLPVPASQSQSIPTGPQGGIELQLQTMDVSSNLQFALDLGLGLSQGSTLPCFAGTGIVGNAAGLTCTLTTKPASPSSALNLYITVTNFEAIAAGKAVSITFPGVSNPQSFAAAPSVIITTYSITNRIRLNLNTATVMLTPVPSLAGNIVTSPAVFTSSSPTVSTVTTLTGTISPVTLCPAAVLLILFQPTHGSGYCQPAVVNQPQSVTVNAASYPLTCYPGADVLVVNMAAALATGAQAFVLTNLVNPDSVPSASDLVTVYTISAGAVCDVISYANALPTQAAGAFLTSTLTPSTYFSGASYVTYTISQQFSHSVPLGGSIVLTYPGIFVFQNSSPVPYCSFSGLVAASTGSLTCVAYSNVVTVKGFAAIPPSSSQWTIIGVKHPSTGTSSGSFLLRTHSAAGLIIDSVALPGFNYQGSFAAGVLSVVYILPSPNNAGAVAEYIFQLTPNHAIGKGGSVVVQFPSSQYPSLPTPPVCRARGAFSTFSSCVTSGTTITVTLNADCPASTFVLSIFGITNPQATGPTVLFTISTVYDGVTLDISGVSVTSTHTAQAVITPVAPVLQVNRVDFAPKNEGEKSTYVFTLTPSVSITSSSQLTITFPPSYDKRLGDGLRCWATGLGGNLSCVVVSAYQLQVQGNDSFTACSTCQIVLTVYGILNPQKSPTSNTGQFQAGTLAGVQYLEFTAQAAALDLLSPPSLNTINNLTLDNYDSRADNRMVFNMTVTLTIPMASYGGAVWIVFPQEYMWDGTTPLCSSSRYWAGGAPICSLYFDTIKITGSVTDFVGLLIISLLNVPNPQQQMTARSIIVKTYDGFNSKILDSSYINLSPTAFSYTFPGPLITINKDRDIAVQRGTATQLIPVELVYPCALNLTLTPLLPGLTVTPQVVDMTLGQTVAYFRISAAQTSSTRNYTMIWTTTGEVVPRYYTPLPKLVVSVINTQIYQVLIDAIDPVPIGGASVPVRVSVSNPPDLDVTVAMTLDPELLGVSLEPDQLHFMPGETELYFRIIVTSAVQTGSSVVSVSLSGTNVAYYTLPSTSIPYSLVSDSGLAPSLSPISTSYLGKSKALITLSGNVMGTVYFLCALAGTATPPFEEVKTAGPAPHLSTRSLYGAVHLHANRTSTASIKDLIAARTYTLFGYLEDLMGRQSLVMTSTFHTPPLAVPVYTSLRINQTSLNDVEVSLALEAVGLLLALEDYRMPVLQVDSSAARNNMTVLTFALVDTPFSDSYPSPLDLVSFISGNKSKLAARIAHFDSQFDVLGVTINNPECVFASPPAIGNFISESAISISASLVLDGEIAVLAIANSTNSSNVYSWQVQLALSPANLPAPGLRRSVAAKTVLNDTLTGLAPSTQYDLYFTCGNADPTFASLLPDSKVVKVTEMTQASTKEQKLNINWGAITGLSLVLLM